MRSTSSPPSAPAQRSSLPLQIPARSFSRDTHQIPTVCKIRAAARNPLPPSAARAEPGTHLVSSARWMRAGLQADTGPHSHGGLCGVSVGGHSFGFPASPRIRTYCKFPGSSTLAPAPPQSLSHDKVPVQKLYGNWQCVARVTHKLTAGNEEELCFPPLGRCPPLQMLCRTARHCLSLI